MPQAKILINGAPVSALDLPVGGLVQLDNDGLGDEHTYLWALLDVPAGSAAALSDPGIQNPTFTSDCEGTYLVKLVVDLGMGTETADQKVAAVLQLKIGERVPACTETTEANAAKGWGPELNRWLRLADSRLASPGVVVAQASAPITRGMPAWISGTATIKAGLPGEEVVPTCAQARGTQLVELVASCGIVEGRIDGNPAVGAGDLCVVRILGLVGPFGGPLVLADLVYVSDAGALDNAPGTYPRCIGRVVADAAGDYWVFVDGIGFPGAMVPPDPARRDAPAILSWGNGSTPAAAGTYYVDPWWRKPVITTDEVFIVVPYDGVISRLRCRAVTAPVGDNAVFVVRINGVDSALGAAMIPPSRSANDVVNEIDVSAGDDISMSLTLEAAIAAGPALFTATIALTRR